MQYTQLGERGPRVSRIAFGNWSAGGDWGSVDRDAAIAAVRAAHDLGITLFDTARAYGFGAAEELLGEALRPQIRSARESIVIATKGGLRDEGGSPVRDSSPAALRHDLEASLRSLGTDYIDIYYVHWPDPATPIAETAETLDAFVREGKVRFVGVSNYDTRQMSAFQQVRPIDTIQPPYHLFRRDIERSVLPFAEEHDIGVMVYGPLAHGLLTGRMTEATTFAPDDWRSKSPDFTGDAFRQNIQIVRELQDFAWSRGTTVAQLAIAWTLADPAVDVAIVGRSQPPPGPPDGAGRGAAVVERRPPPDRGNHARRGPDRRTGARGHAKERTRMNETGTARGPRQLAARGSRFSGPARWARRSPGAWPRPATHSRSGTERDRGLRHWASAASPIRPSGQPRCGHRDQQPDRPRRARDRGRTPVRRAAAPRGRARAPARGRAAASVRARARGWAGRRAGRGRRDR